MLHSRIDPAGEIGNAGFVIMEADPSRQGGTYNHDDPTGSIGLNALRLKVAARVQRKK